MNDNITSFPWEKLPVFAGLDVSALDFLKTRAEELRAGDGEVIIGEGEPGNKMFLVQSGKVKVWKFDGAQETVELAELGSGDFFGEMCILETLPRTATVVTEGESVLYSLSSMSFYQLYQAMPAQYSILVLNIARDISRRLRKLDERFAARH